MKKIITVVVGTKSYLKPMQACFRRIHSAIKHAKREDQEHLLICVTDKASKKDAEFLLKKI